jgi:hypothetical protein
MLEKDPAARPQAMTDIVRAFEQQVSSGMAPEGPPAGSDRVS